MATILFCDARIDARPPGGFEHVIETNSGTDLFGKINELVNWMRGSQPLNGWYHSMHILCHGRDRGLELGSIPLTQHNIFMFYPLSGLIGEILIHSCNAACSYPDTGYNGSELCSRLARTVGATVMASDARQPYQPDSYISNPTNTTRLPGWRGNVGTWLPNGRLSHFINYH